MSKDKQREWTEMEIILGQRQSECDNCDGRGYIEGYDYGESSYLGESNIMCEQCEGHKEMTEYL